MKILRAVALQLTILLTFNLSAQFPNLPRPNLPGVTTESIDLLKKKLITRMENARKEYDEASFNYAVALSDNAGLYENEQKARRNQRLLLDVLKTTDGQTLSEEEKASNYNEAGEIFYAGNHFAAAEGSFKQCMLLCEKNVLTSNPVYSLAISNLGLLYHTTGRYDLSEKYTRKALDLRKETFSPEHASYGASLNNLAVLYKDMGKYNEAESFIGEAIGINEKTLGKTSVPYALALNNQAMILQAMGRYNLAEPVLKQSIDIAGQTLKEKSTNYVRLMINLALLYQDMKKYTESEEIYLKAIKIKENRLGTNHPDYAHLLNNLAALYMLMNRYDKVEELLKKAAGIYKKQFGDRHPSYASTISNLGNFYRVSGRTSEAEPLLKQAADIRRQTLGENHPDYVSSQESLGLLCWQTGKTEEAATLLRYGLDKSIEHIQLYFAPMSEAEKAKFWEKLRPRFLRFNSFVAEAVTAYPALAGDLYNYQLATKALLLNATSKVKHQILTSGDRELVQEYEAWLDEKENLARLYTLSKAELAEEKINIDSLEKACNEREKKLSQKSDLFSKQYSLKNISYQDVRQTLEPSDAAVEIIQFNKFNKTFTDTICYLALVVTRENNYPSLVLMTNGNQLEKKYYNIYKNSIKLKLKDETSYAQFWGRIENAVQGKKNLYLSLDGIYNQISLNTLQNSEGYLVDQKNLRIVTNTRDIPGLKKSTGGSSSNSAVLVGYPDYGTAGAVTPLPGTKTEIEAIRSVLSTGKYNPKVYLQREATEQNLKAVKNPKVLHIATHGFFLTESDGNGTDKVFGIESGKSKENPMLRSGVLLADAEKAMDGKSENGVLFAFEAMNLMLDNTDLVVLSACETGLGDVKNGEGVYGLQRAFQVAGAKAIIMSLWKVNDDATQQLMRGFYKYYVQGNPAQIAFKKAQQELKIKFKDPYYWGAFVMVE